MMPRNSERLLPVELPKLVKTKGMHHDGRGLYLKASPPGGASWVLRYMLDKQPHTMGLGPYPEISLKAARAKALEARRLKAERVDPIATRRAERAASVAAANVMTFKAAAEAFIASKQSGWRHKGKTADWVYPIIGHKPVAAIDTAAVIAVLTQNVDTAEGPARFWEARSETASRCRARIENVLDYAKARGERVGDNPADWATLRFTLPKRHDVRAVKNHDAMAYDLVPAYVASLRQKTALSARALEFTILTAARTTEVRGMVWAEVDLEKAVWTVPASRMKTKKEHRVPLTDRAVAILKGLEQGEGSDLVFPGTKPGRPMSENTMLKLLQDEHDDVTVHGFRSSLSTWARELTSFPRDVVEAALAHTVGDAVERAYARTTFFDKRRDLLNAWTAYCEGRAAGNVTPIRAA
jgi:integrase